MLKGIRETVMNIGDYFRLPIEIKILLLIGNLMFLPHFLYLRNELCLLISCFTVCHIIFFSFFSSEPNLLVRACNQLGQFLTHRETNLRYLALESMCLLATSEFSHDAVKKHQVNFF